MYVLMDIEWIALSDGAINPTQIAAMKVDDRWNEIDTYFARIRPKHELFHEWRHMGYSGGEPDEFLNADSMAEVFRNLDRWLNEDDVLCWWTPDSIQVLDSLFFRALGRRINRKNLLLRDYLFPFLADQGIAAGNPYKIAESYGIPRFRPPHQSLSDVQTMRSVLACFKFPIGELEGATDALQKPIRPTNQFVTDDWPYQYDETTGYVHKKDCSAIPPDAHLTGYMKLQTCLKKKLLPCPACLAEESKQVRKDRLQDIIDRSQYQYIYSDKSQVFHRRDCKLALNTTGTILGSVYYDGCIRAGRRPCKICNPEPGTWLSTKGQKKAQKKAKAPRPDAVIPARSMNAGEQRAYKRYVEARGERLAGENTEFNTQTERDDFFTLTQPKYAFFSAAGYMAFHRRNCGKLQGLTNITGFARYKDAVRAGHTPCKYCKPTAKDDIQCSIPITNKKRKDESINDLRQLCAEKGYAYEMRDQYFYFVTPVGRWKIDVSAHPYIVYHINRVMAPHNEHDYHKQPRLFLSLADTFWYIQRHDKDLMSRVGVANGAEE